MIIVCNLTNEEILKFIDIDIDSFKFLYELYYKDVLNTLRIQGIYIKER